MVGDLYGCKNMLRRIPTVGSPGRYGYTSPMTEQILSSIGPKVHLGKEGRYWQVLNLKQLVSVGSVAIMEKNSPGHNITAWRRREECVTLVCSISDFVSTMTDVQCSIEHLS